MTLRLSYMNKQMWNAERFGFTAGKLYARATSAVKSKIICISIPKAGTHLLERVLCLHPALYRPLLRTLNDSNIQDYGGLERVLHKLRAGQVLFTHLRYQNDYAEAIRTNNIRALFLVRDPRDVAVSRVFYAMKTPSNHMHQIYKKRRDFRERLIIAITGSPEMHYQDSIRSSFRRFAGWLDSGVLAVRFEDLVGNRGGGDPNSQRSVLSQLYDFIDVGLSEQELQKISERVFSVASPTFRKGSIGGWRDLFDSETKFVFKESANELLVQYGYERNLDW